MTRRICLINAHPDPSAERFCHALADAYQAGAESGGHAVRRVNAGAIEYGFLSSAAEFEHGPDGELAEVREAIAWCDHLLLIYPLWLGSLPAKAKALLEHVARGGFLVDVAQDDEWPAKKMKGKSARLIVTMGMPGFAYRLFLRSHSVRALESGILAMAGFKPVRDTVFGLIEGGAKRRALMLEKTRALGARAI